MPKVIVLLHLNSIRVVDWLMLAYILNVLIGRFSSIIESVYNVFVIDMNRSNDTYVSEISWLLLVIEMNEIVSIMNLVNWYLMNNSRICHSIGFQNGAEQLSADGLPKRIVSISKWSGRSFPSANGDAYPMTKYVQYASIRSKSKSTSTGAKQLDSGSILGKIIAETSQFRWHSDSCYAAFSFRRLTMMLKRIQIWLDRAALSVHHVNRARSFALICIAIVTCEHESRLGGLPYGLQKAYHMRVACYRQPLQYYK